MIDSLENIKNGIANGSVTVEEVNLALCDGIKQHYGAEGLHFFRGYTPGSMSDAYGFIPRPSTIIGNPSYSTGDTWLCQASPDSKYLPVVNPQDLEILVGDFFRGKVKVFFVDSGKDYDSLHDLRHDHMAMQLSGITERYF